MEQATQPNNNMTRRPRRLVAETTDSSELILNIKICSEIIIKLDALILKYT